MKTIFMSKHSTTTNILVFDKDRFVEMAALCAQYGFPKQAQLDVLSDCLTNYEVNNCDVPDFMKALNSSKNKVELIDENNIRTFTFDVSERTSVAITPILIPLHLIDPYKPNKEAAVVLERTTPDGKTAVEGKDLYVPYILDGKAHLETNELAVIANGAFLVKGGLDRTPAFPAPHKKHQPKKEKCHEDDGRGGM